jgi:CBS domain containing-hemolysin-like protein
MQRATSVHGAAAWRRRLVACNTLLAALLATSAHASFLSGDALDEAADIVAWVALVIGPIVAIAVFWIVHILPEKIAEDRKHPQAKAIQTLCLLSLFFGGLLWPIAWLWAYTKPVLHKMAYGTDVEEHEEAGHTGHKAVATDDADAQHSRVIKVIDREHERPIENATNRERA